MRFYDVAGHLRALIHHLLTPSPRSAELLAPTPLDQLLRSATARLRAAGLADELAIRSGLPPVHGHPDLICSALAAIIVDLTNNSHERRALQVWARESGRRVDLFIE